MSLFDLTGKVAVVTGSSRGIGRAIAERLAEHGAKVAISSRKPAACEAVVRELEAKYGVGCAVSIPANISSKEDLRHLAEVATTHFGRIDILICNAASNPYYGPLADISDDQFRKILDNNIIANHWLISFVAPQMIARKEGSIVIVSSVGGLKASTRSAPITFPRRPISNWRAIWPPNSARIMCASIASRPGSCAPTLPARFGRTRTV
jgi:NAD(P)-dependent dehydrogenase (short-subunit alcohol dehydrogenase family)